MTATEAGSIELTPSPDGRSIEFELDESLYPLDAIYGAAYLFIDRCFVFLSRPAEDRVTIRLRAREADGAAVLESVAGELANELLNQVVRLRVGQSTSRIRDYYMARALAAGVSHPSIDELLSELEMEDLENDPLDILVPWEEKHGDTEEVGRGE